MILPGTVGIKNTDVFQGLLQYPVDARLSDIILWIADKYGVFFTETYRPKQHANDLHGTVPLRAIDLRSWAYNGGVERAKKIEKDINEVWEYDPQRVRKKVAILHDTGKGIHFHIQSHPRTRRRHVPETSTETRV